MKNKAMWSTDAGTIIVIRLLSFIRGSMHYSTTLSKHHNITREAKDVKVLRTEYLLDEWASFFSICSFCEMWVKADKSWDTKNAHLAKLGGN